jgi:regulator of sigma E protease
MSYLIMLFLISLLVILHEVGHMAVAQRCGVKVERFGLGLPFGPTLFEKEWKGIKWCLHILPLGGYVSFPDDNEDSDVPPDSPQRFENQPLLNQAAIAMAGITVNAVIAVVLMFAVLGVWGAIQSQLQITGFAPVLTEKEAVKTPSTLGRLAFYDHGKRLYLDATTPIETAVLFRGFLAHNIDQQLDVAPVSNPKRVLLTYETSPAQAVGLQVGDVLLEASSSKGIQSSLEGFYSEPTQALPAFLAQCQTGDALTFHVAEGDLTDTPKLAKTATRQVTFPLSESRKLGVYLGMVQEKVPVGLATNLRLTASVLTNMVVQNFVGLGKLFTGQISPDMLDGPVGVVRFGGELIEKTGIQSGLWLTAVISIILAVMNLLPFPPLDGSYLVYIGYEALFKRSFPPTFRHWMNLSGFIVLMGMMIFVLGNDILKLFR